MTENTERRIDCDKHGNTKWQGHILCGTCGRVFQTKDDFFPLFAPIECLCGVRLMPDETDDKVEFSACVLCFQCFRKVVKKFGGKLPQPPQRAVAKA